MARRGSWSLVGLGMRGSGTSSSSVVSPPNFISSDKTPHVKGLTLIPKPVFLIKFLRFSFFCSLGSTDPSLRLFPWTFGVDLASWLCQTCPIPRTVHIAQSIPFKVAALNIVPWMVDCAVLGVRLMLCKLRRVIISLKLMLNPGRTSRFIY